MKLETRDIVQWIRANCLEGDPSTTLGEDTPLLDAPLLDSMQIMLLVGFLEEQIGGSVPLEEVVPENFETPGTIAALAARLHDQTGDGSKR